MTNPTPISTASSSDDLVERCLTTILQHAADGQNGSASYALDRLKQIQEVALLCLNRRPQPVAGDVVERAAAAGICDFLASIYEGPDRNDATSMLLEAKRQILELPKLIGGGK